MPLIACPECAAQVSDRSATCVKCGCPLHPAATDDATLSEQQKRAVEMLRRGAKPLVVAKATGVALKGIHRLSAELRSAAVGGVGMAFIAIAWALTIAAFIIGVVPVKRSNVELMTLLYLGVGALSFVFILLDRAAVARAAGRAPDVLMALLLRPIYFFQRGNILGHGKWMAWVDLTLLVTWIVVPFVLRK